MPSGFYCKRKHCMIKWHLCNVCPDRFCTSDTIFFPSIKVDKSLIIRILLLFLSMQCLIKLFYDCNYSFPPITCFVSRNCRAGIYCKYYLEFWNHTFRVPIWERKFHLGRMCPLRRWHPLISLNISKWKSDPSSLKNSILFWDKADCLGCIKSICFSGFCALVFWGTLCIAVFLSIFIVKNDALSIF